MSSDTPDNFTKETYELRFMLLRANAMQLKGKLVCEDIITAVFEPQTGKYTVMNQDGPDAKGHEWIGEDADKLEAILKYLRARLGLPAKEAV